MRCLFLNVIQKIFLFIFFLRLMFSRGKFHRLARNEYIPEIIIFINIIIIIYICNTYYEYTGNQYTMRDNDHLNEFCPLYPSSLQGKINVDDIQLNVYVIGNTEEIIMSEHATWSDNLNVQIGMMIDWNGLFDL
jgi:hypothetical protein